MDARLIRTLEVESVAILHVCEAQEQGGNRPNGRINRGAGLLGELCGGFEKLRGGKT
ncbi:MAG: hypothetical protein WA637_02480 [Terriglobales bacterium]